MNIITGIVLFILGMLTSVIVLSIIVYVIKKRKERKEVK